MQTIRISLPEIDALGSQDPRDFSLIADTDNILIKEHSRGSGLLDPSETVLIEHNIGYVPLFLVYGEMSSGRYRVVNAQNPLGGEWQVFSTSDTLSITNLLASERGYQFYIFYDDMT